MYIVRNFHFLNIVKDTLILTLFGPGGGGGSWQNGPSPGFSSIGQKLFNQSSPIFLF